jgi:hypothetical protein
MLYIKPIMNSSVEEVLGFKTCCGLKMFDQNLEIHVRNLGDEPVTVRGYFDLTGDFGTRKFEALSPGGDQTIAAGDIASFYCYMDQDLWDKSDTMVFSDSEGNQYDIAISHRTKKDK